MKNQLKKIAAITLMLVMIILPAGMFRTVYAADLSGMTDQQKNSSYGFFVWLSSNARTAAEREDAQVAVQILTNTVSSTYRSRVFNDGSIYGGSGTVTYQDLLNATHIGAKYDATALDNVMDAIDYINIGNERRAREGLAPLKVSSGLMAIAEINANYQHGLKNDHSSVFMSLENLFMFAVGGSSGDKLSIDPYYMWYDNEKVNFDTNNGKVTGHYKTLTDRQGVMQTTGFGAQDSFEVVDGKNWHAKYYSQHFSNNAWMYNISSGVTTDQYIEYLKRYCSMLGHSWSDWTTAKEATEISEGTETRKCTVCGETETRTIARLGHSLVKVPAVSATCTSDGSIEYWRCEGCGKIFEDSSGTKEITKSDTVVKATGHKPVAMQDVDPTCTQDGHKGGKQCSVCGAVVESPEYIPATGHEWSEWIPVAIDAETNRLLVGRYCMHDNCEEVQTSLVPIPDEQQEDSSESTEPQNEGLSQDEEEEQTTQPDTAQPEQTKTTDLRIKSLWASQHSAGEVLFKWTQKEGTVMDEDDMWVLKYRMRKIGGNAKWSEWYYEEVPSDVMGAWIEIDTDYVVEIHAQATGDTTWSTGIITCPAGGRYQAMKTAHVINTKTGKRLAERSVSGSAIAHTSINLKVGQTLSVKPAYDYPVKNIKKRPRLYPSHMLYDIGDKSMITITKPDGSKYTGGIIDGAAAIKATKTGKTTIIFRSPNGRTMIGDVTVTN